MSNMTYLCPHYRNECSFGNKTNSKDNTKSIIMSKVTQEALAIRYKMYRRRVKEIKKELKETQARAIVLTAIEYRVTERTIINAIKNRPSKAKK